MSLRSTPKLIIQLCEAGSTIEYFDTLVFGDKNYSSRLQDSSVSFRKRVCKRCF